MLGTSVCTAIHLQGFSEDFFHFFVRIRFLLVVHGPIRSDLFPQRFFDPVATVCGPQEAAELCHGGGLRCIRHVFRQSRRFEGLQKVHGEISHVDFIVGFAKFRQPIQNEFVLPQRFVAELMSP